MAMALRQSIWKTTALAALLVLFNDSFFNQAVVEAAPFLRPSDHGCRNTLPFLPHTNAHSPLFREVVGVSDTLTTSSNNEEATITMPSPRTMFLFRPLPPFPNYSGVLVSFVQLVLQRCRDMCGKIPFPNSIASILSFDGIQLRVCVAIVGALSGYLLHRVIVQHQRRAVEYLIWDAKELVPHTWTATEEALNAAVVDYENDDERSSSLAQMLQRQPDIQQKLSAKVNQAKALQVAGIYQKHFPDEWKKIQSKKQFTNGASRTLAKSPRLLKRLTLHIYRHKFTALLRPDYSFGIGCNGGIDLTKMMNGGMVDPMLLKQVTEDLMATCPTDYPEIWEEYTSKLLPGGQTLWDRHDLVLKMVKDVQLEKAKIELSGSGNKNVTAPTTWSGNGCDSFNKLSSSELNRVSPERAG